MFIDSIAEHIREAVALRKRQLPLALLCDRPLFRQPRRGFAERLKGGTLRIIAEIKRASPSQGLIRAQFDPVAIARDFSANGASALSVLTEERFFHGSLDYLERIRAEIPLPLLRKDFVLDSYQLLEAKSFGADAVLLIAALLETSQLRELKAEAGSLSLDALVEVHTEEELERALGAGAELIGINNRDLKTFEVKLETAERLAPKVPPGITVVCESGIDRPEQIKRFEKLGVHVFLVGEALMRAKDPGAKLRELLGNSE
ncbi:MAG: indole-3-glycerol phosphate synthase TrpC [Deltaproteobacteria bacterium]|nr:indole-3-glycerol phosphate synthase TrpC [Deltaproteobacteria bacterium]